MYCKYCGEQNINNQTYCENCGKKLSNNTISLEKSTISVKKTDFCKKCGTQIKERYCSECGAVAYTLDIKQEAARFKAPDININIGSLDDLKSKLKESPISEIRSVDDVKAIVSSKPVLKTSFISSIKILGIGLLISLLIFMAITNIEPVEEILYAIDQAANYGYPQISKLKPNFVDIFNLSLQAPTNISMNFAGDDYGAKIDIGAKAIMSFKLLILLIIPAIAVIISQLKLFKNESSSSENILEYGVTSLIFSILVKIIALINKRTVKIADDYDMFTFKLGISFSDLWSLLTIFMIIFAMHIVISMIIKKDNPFGLLNIKQYPDLGNRIYTYIKSMGIYVGIVSVAMLIILIYMINDGGAEGAASVIIGVLMAPALFIHMWLLSFGYNMDTAATGQKTMTFSIWKSWSGLGELRRITDSGTAWGYLFILGLIIGLIYVIYRVTKDIESEGYFVKLGFIAGAISIINLLLSYLGSIGIKVNSKVSGDMPIDLRDVLYEFDLEFLEPIISAGGLNQSYSIVSIVLLTFIWVFPIGAIIYFTREKDIYYKISSFLDEYKQKLTIGYSALILVSFYLLQSKVLSNMADVIFRVFPMMNILM